MVPLNFTEDDVTWVTSKFSGAAGVLVAEAMELQHWILCFGCASEKLRVVVRLDNWMTNSFPPWAVHCSQMTCCLVAPDKRPGVRPVGIEETPLWALAKFLMRAAWDQAKTVYGNLQLCAGLEPGIEGSTHSVRQKILYRVKERRSEEEGGSTNKEEEIENVEVELNNLSIETEGKDQGCALWE